MKTVLLAPELFSSNGGIPRILRLYLKALCDLASPAGEVAFVALNDAVADSSDLRRYTTNRLVSWETCSRRKGRFVRAALRAARGADLLVCGHVAQLPVAWLARRLNPKFRYTLIAHGIEVWRPFTLLERLALRRAHAAWCVSDFTRRELLSRCALPPARALVVPNALDPYFDVASPEAATADRAASAEPVILAVSRLDRSDNYKGVDHLIEAMPAILAKIPQARLHVVGQGNDLPRLQKLTQQRSLNGAVRFLGFVNDAELKRELLHCRLFALPSEKEGFGLVYLEAMAHGRPCLAARAGGAPEVISSDTGVLTPFGDVPALAQASIDALQRSWDTAAILARAESFSYSRFRDRLAPLLSP
jgi:phosphatidyl-myo-inositol dimannoside synthase